MHSRCTGLTSNSASTVKRRRKEMKFHGSRSTMKTLDPYEAEQLVVKAMDKDPAKRSGVQTIHHRVAFDSTVHLSWSIPFQFLGIRPSLILSFSIRDFVSQVMHTHDSDAFAAREPTAKRIFCVKKFPIGIHARWAADGHDKLYKIGFPIWAIIEDATGKWLGGWAVPSNRTGNIVAYLWLCTVEKYRGKCITTASFFLLTPVHTRHSLTV